MAYCPFTKEPCDEEACGLWDGYGEKCSLRSIARSLDLIESHLDGITDSIIGGHQE